jgi:probable F420-dependent oxidoreductase
MIFEQGPLRIAITLPQLGHASSGPNIRRAARQAEELGYADVWVNDHISFPVGQTHPAPYMYDPLLSLATAAAVTERIGLGSQITAAYYPPVYLANALASLDSLSGGRLKIAVGVGWSQKEFEALGSDFHTRGKRTDEIIEILRTCWESKVASHAGEHYSFPPLKILPPPAHRIPVWIAGNSEPVYRRAARLGDGFHGGSEPRFNMAMPGVVARLRADRPDPADFTCSVYTHDWDPAERPADDIRRERDFYGTGGVQHVVAALSRRDIDAWLASVDRLATILAR